MLGSVFSLFVLPRERSRRPVALALLVQAIALVGLVPILRDLRPDPVRDSAEWQTMSSIADFWPIASIALLTIVMGFALWHALDREIDATRRARECRILFVVFAAGTFGVGGELLYFGAETGLWTMFGAMLGLVLADLALTFLILRYLDIESVRTPAGPRASGIAS